MVLPLVPLYNANSMGALADVNSLLNLIASAVVQSAVCLFESLIRFLDVQKNRGFIMSKTTSARYFWSGLAILTIGLTFGHGAVAQTDRTKSQLDSLMIYQGHWSVRAAHPWSGAARGAIDQLESKCNRFTLYLACEQTVNGKPQSLIVYTVGTRSGLLHTRFISPNGLAGGRGELTIEGDRWTYLDKPPTGLSGPWSRVENVIVNRDRIRFKEYESVDEGKQWTLKNSGSEDRVHP